MPENEVVNVLRGFDEIPFQKIGLVILAAYLIIVISKRLVALMVQRLPETLRFYLLPWPPIIRLVTMGGTVALITPMVIRPDAGAVSAALGTLALTFGFAFKDYVASLVAGVVVLFERPFVIGDRVAVGDHEGEVISMDLRSFAIQTLSDDCVVIPYGALWTSPVANATSGNRAQQVTTRLYLDPEHDSKPVVEKLQDVILTSPFLAAKGKVSVLVQERRGATCYLMKAYPRDAVELSAFATDLTVRGRAALRRMGLQLAHTPELGGAD